MKLFQGQEKVLFTFEAAVLLLLAFLGVRQYKTAYRYTEYTVAWEREIPASESGFTGYE